MAPAGDLVLTGSGTTPAPSFPRAFEVQSFSIIAQHENTSLYKAKLGRYYYR